MNDALTFLVHHGHAVLFGVAVVNQLGLPFPAAPWLLAAGALAHMGRLEVFASLALAVAASLLAHIAWYEAGRRSGIKILRLVCRVSIEPDACVRKTENLFARRGPRALVVAHFVPGLVTVAQPLAGTLGMPRAQFIAYNLAGALIWAGGFIILGYVFSHQLEAVAAIGLRLGGALLGVLVAAILGWVGWKVYLRYRIMSELRIARISAEELKERMDAGDAIFVLDLRHDLELAGDPAIIPGARHIPAEQIETRHDEVPRDGEVVVYCS
ncbi:MAG TPA: VTT domain-containing protein [Haliangiales bacterium]|nr:VTT domain-containing protein [Haliangiales bacterium]